MINTAARSSTIASERSRILSANRTHVLRPSIVPSTGRHGLRHLSACGARPPSARGRSDGQALLNIPRPVALFPASSDRRNPSVRTLNEFGPEPPERGESTGGHPS